MLIKLLLVLGMAAGPVIAEESLDRPILRVCADPYLMPFSNQKEEGLENKIASLLAKSLGAKLEYEWFPQRIGFIRNTLKAEEGGRFKCDLVMSVPEHFELAATTKPYYAATYALVYVKGQGLDSVTKPEMLGMLNQQGKKIKFGLFDRGPAQFWVFQHGLMDNAVPYPLQTGDARDNPGEIMLQNLIAGRFDATIVWGPTAAYFASRHKDEAELVILPMQDDKKLPQMKFVYNMSMAVRHGETAWKKQLNELIDEHQQQINKIIQSYGIPLVEVRPKPAPEDD